MAKILIESGPLRGQSLILSPGRPLAIGRDARCAVRCQDALVSRVHAVLRPKGDQWLLQDRDSANGTFINEAPIQTAKLSGGDVIRVGDTLLSFVVEDDDPLLKREVAGYRLERRLGRGASGTVYLALQISLDRTVAVKILAPRLARNPELVGRFLEEARAVARLNHPHVVQIHDAGQVDDLFFMSMEYLSGGTLEETLSREKQLPPHRVIEVGVDAAKALVFAEQNHIVHRDIKPANLLLSAKGAVKLGDLGIAIDVRRTPGGKGSGLAGSPRYMAPEQASDGAVDHRADIYALGATLYRALSGVAPFEGSTIQEILRAKLERDPVPLRRLLPNLSLSLSNVIQKMLARQPEMRFSSAAEVEDALERCSRMKTAARRPAAEASPRRPVPSRPLAPRPKTRTPPWVFAAAAVVLLAVGLVAAKVMFPGSAQERPPRDASGAAGAASRVVSAPPDAGGASPSRAASSAFSLQVARETLDRIEADYREGRIRAEEAEERLVKLLEGPGADSGIAQRVEALLA
ncbi:MAG: protein kinase, partial [Planctomycetes bacterium]|nr:protein kinase [Planctomycetota bacterium]